MPHQWRPKAQRAFWLHKALQTHTFLHATFFWKETGWDPGDPYQMPVFPLLSGFLSNLHIFINAAKKAENRSTEQAWAQERRQKGAGAAWSSKNMHQGRSWTSAGCSHLCPDSQQLQSRPQMVPPGAVKSYQFREEKLSLNSPTPGAGTGSSPTLLRRGGNY